MEKCVCGFVETEKEPFIKIDFLTYPTIFLGKDEEFVEQKKTAFFIACPKCKTIKLL